ncbi:MAG: SDR family oxidoreductase [Campylobacterales bacterium]
MSKALVSGASSGIGEAITLKLLSRGYEVIGIGRDFRTSKINSKNFTPFCFDLTSSEVLEIEPYIDGLSVLVNAAGVGEFGEFRDSEYESIKTTINTNLLAPLLLSRLCIDELIKTKGYVFNVTSVEATRSSKLSSIYTASKAGLRAFSLALFEEIRQKGVKVISLNPDITDTNFFDNLFFGISNKQDSFLLPNQIANTVEYILDLGQNACISDVTIRAQISKVSKKDKR